MELKAHSWPSVCLIAGCSLSAAVWVFVASRTLQQHTEFPLTFLQLCFIYLFIYFQIESFTFVQHLSNIPKLHLKFIIYYFCDFPYHKKRRNNICRSLFKSLFWIEDFSYVTKCCFFFCFFFCWRYNKETCPELWVCLSMLQQVKDGAA